MKSKWMFRSVALVMMVWASGLIADALDFNLWKDLVVYAGFVSAAIYTWIDD